MPASFLMPFHISVGSSARQVLLDACSSLLGAVEQQLVMNLSRLDSPIQTSTMPSWVTREGKAWAHPLFYHLVRCDYCVWLGSLMMLLPRSLDYTFCQIIPLSSSQAWFEHCFQDKYATRYHWEVNLGQLVTPSLRILAIASKRN
jgi:hypothetical protein